MSDQVLASLTLDTVTILIVMTNVVFLQVVNGCKAITTVQSVHHAVAQYQGSTNSCDCPNGLLLHNHAAYCTLRLCDLGKNWLL